MSVYGYIQKQIAGLELPIAGVVERSVGTWIFRGVVNALVESKIIVPKLKTRLTEVIDRYSITDDFLFGCVLREGEYLTPIEINKNPRNRARQLWQIVVGQYPKPFATVLKSDEAKFPFRLELNPFGRAQCRDVCQLLYHTARLLPRYAFPVGLDIVDKYAKVPEWISRGVSKEMAAGLMRRILQTGDERLVAQFRELLAGSRDFFFRPHA
jgi:hypothetical protein